MKFLPSTNTHRLVAGLAEPLCGRGGDSQSQSFSGFLHRIAGFHPKPSTSTPVSL